MARKGMGAGQIKRCLLARCETRPAFEGVFSLDTLPKLALGERPRLVVCNTAHRLSSGEHWVGMFLDASGNVSFFDSYGLPPSSTFLLDFLYVNSNNSNNWTYNHTQLQSLDSSVCGEYVCVYLYYRIKGYSDRQFVEIFEGQLPDVVVKKEFKNIFGKLGVKRCVGESQYAYKYTVNT